MEFLAFQVFYLMMHIIMCQLVHIMYFNGNKNSLGEIYNISHRQMTWIFIPVLGDILFAYIFVVTGYRLVSYKHYFGDGDK